MVNINKMVAMSWIRDHYFNKRDIKHSNSDGAGITFSYYDKASHSYLLKLKYGDELEYVCSAFRGIEEVHLLSTS